MRQFLRDNGLSVFFLGLFLAALIGQSLVGLANNNEELERHGQAAISYGEFVTSSAFLVDVAENWQSEFLQFFLFIFATIWLVQRGSPESKEPGDAGPDPTTISSSGRARNPIRRDGRGLGDGDRGCIRTPYCW